MVVDVDWQGAFRRHQPAFLDSIIGRNEDLNTNLAIRSVDFDLVKSVASDLLVRTFGDEPSIFGSVAVVFLVGYLVCTKEGSYVLAIQVSMRV